MKDEINKIIQSISDFYKLDNALKYYLDRHKAQILLDYITNLQEENEKYKNVIDKIKECIEEVNDDEFYINLTRKEKVLLKILELLEEVE